jgi:DNA helicase-2/ATP-dependent DNA helicase PcrA
MPIVRPPPIPAARPLVRMPGADFFATANAVMARAGRPPLGQRQRNIIEVCDTDRVLQILAGPGAGKTEVLVWRVLYELFVCGAQASRLMVTTFTRKAAQELNVRMVERSDDFLVEAAAAGIAADDPHVHDIRIGTLHSLCDQLMTEFDDEHLEAGAQVIDEVETKLRLIQMRHWAFKDGDRKVLDELLACEELTCLFTPPWLDNPTRFQQNDLILAVLSQHVETWIPRCAGTGTPNGIEVVHGIAGLTDELMFATERWAERLADKHALDYALLQLRFLERQANLAKALDHVFVDEFQDTNPIQYEIHLGWVRHAGVRLTVVGDDDQALYRWRGSDIGCFASLEPDCSSEGFSYRREILEENNRSTATIVNFARGFREGTVLASDSLSKRIVPPTMALTGDPVRLLEGPWGEVCCQVATEIKALGAGLPSQIGGFGPPTVAVLMASTSEVESKSNTRPALELRRALEAQGLNVYNPRNKAAARPGSPVHDLLGLISYLIDPVIKAPAGKNNRLVMVWASCNDPHKARYAPTHAPPFPVSPAHANIQKRLMQRDDGTIGAPPTEFREIVDYLNEIRDRLIKAKPGEVRLTLGGLVARMLRMEPFRSAGYTVKLFRQALFTQLLEANVAVTRQTRKSLDRPMTPSVNADDKIEWANEYWSMLGTFGQLIEAGGQDDLEVEAFSDDAIALLTFHQAKGLEFDHVYVAMTGKEPDPSAVLATELFSGRTPAYTVIDGRPETTDLQLVNLAAADREREVYVAITRAKHCLTILHAPGNGQWAMQLNQGLADLFNSAPAKPIGAIQQREWIA